MEEVEGNDERGESPPSLSEPAATNENKDEHPLLALTNAATMTICACRSSRETVWGMVGTTPKVSPLIIAAIIICFARRVLLSQKWFLEH